MSNEEAKPNVTGEFNCQVENLVQKGYPKLAGITTNEFIRLIEPLKEKVAKLTVPAIDLEEGRLPFVIVIKSNLVPVEKAMSFVEREGKQGITKLFPLKPEDFKPIEGISIPNSSVYLLIDIDRGKENINMPPNEALKMIVQNNRSPLTIEEGIAIVTHYPEFLMKNNCFSLLASRHTGDKRVPAIWINSEKRPNLGWCWDGNSHTWLGSASCDSRVGSSNES
jgi:hypothetical protein